MQKSAQVVHGGDNDILWLQRELHIYIANLFDTEKAASVSLSPSCVLFKFHRVTYKRSIRYFVLNPGIKAP